MTEPAFGNQGLERMIIGNLKVDKNRRVRGYQLLLPAVLLTLASCSRQQTLRGLFEHTTPHETYARQLERAGLDRRPAGQSWLAAADRALRDSLLVTLPFAETGYFVPGQPTAASYRYAVRGGEQIHVSLTLLPGTAARVFVDAFELRPGRPAERLASADTTVLDFRYPATEAGQHLVRVQPELLAAGRYTLTIRREAGLTVFPVQGRTDAAIGSFWGSARDGGARQHEGVDIFAPRGTPAVAAAGGFVTRTGITRLGGKVVWLRDTEGGNHLYYAHLDSQLVQPGQQVRAGDTLGLVGNTGNARTTAPHLHFGVYRAGRGAVDPLPYVHRADPVPPAPAGPDQRAEWVRLTSAQPLQATAQVAALKSKSKALKSNAEIMSRNAPLLVLGRQQNALRVQTPSGQLGYVPAAAAVSSTARPLRRLKLPAEVEISTMPLPEALPVAAWPARTAVAVLAEANGYALLRDEAGAVGWAKI